MSDLMKYNAILPKDDDYHLWYDSLKGWRLNIRGVGNSPFNFEADVLFEIERERIIKLLEPYANAKCDEYCGYSCECYGKYEAKRFIALIKEKNK